MHLLIEADGATPVRRDRDGLVESRMIQPVRARRVGRREAEEVADGGLAALEVDRVERVWERDDAADHAVLSGEVGGG